MEVKALLSKSQDRVNTEGCQEGHPTWNFGQIKHASQTHDFRTGSAEARVNGHRWKLIGGGGREGDQRGGL